MGPIRLIGRPVFTFLRASLLPLYTRGASRQRREDPSGEYTRLAMMAMAMAVMVVVAATDGITSVNWAKSRLASITETGTQPGYSLLFSSPPLSGETDAALTVARSIDSLIKRYNFHVAWLHEATSFDR